LHLGVQISLFLLIYMPPIITGLPQTST